MDSRSTIPEKLFFRIGEVCDLMGVQPHVLRYWETEFPMLAPQKNRAGQRVYRRKDVEMVMRIRELLYEEKFTIAGAKKKLLEEMRSRSTLRGTKAASREAVARDSSADELTETHAPVTETPSGLSEQALTPQARRVLRRIKRDLEDLLTMLNSDASIKG
jgi:DNA-binding transcriptional MerR regulator